MENKTTLRQQIEAFKEGRFLDSDGKEDNRCFLFYDWFCNDTSLKKKAQTLFPKVIKFVHIMNIDMDKHYLWFKNNCPMDGPLYDDFRISDLETYSNMFVVTPKSGHTGLAEAYSYKTGYSEPFAKGRTFTDLLLECTNFIKEKSAS